MSRRSGAEESGLHPQAQTFVSSSKNRRAARPRVRPSRVTIQGLFQAAPYNGPAGPGNYSLQGSNYADCSLCLFVNDDPHNYGDIIRPTEYDGDCDECGETTMWAHYRGEEE